MSGKPGEAQISCRPLLSTVPFPGSGGLVSAGARRNHAPPRQSQVGGLQARRLADGMMLNPSWCQDQRPHNGHTTPALERGIHTCTLGHEYRIVLFPRRSSPTPILTSPSLFPLKPISQRAVSRPATPKSRVPQVPLRRAPWHHTMGWAPLRPSSRRPLWSSAALSLRVPRSPPAATRKMGELWGPVASSVSGPWLPEPQMGQARWFPSPKSRLGGGGGGGGEAGGEHEESMRGWKRGLLFSVYFSISSLVVHPSPSALTSTSEYILRSASVRICPHLSLTSLPQLSPQFPLPPHHLPRRTCRRARTSARPSDCSLVINISVR